MPDTGHRCGSAWKCPGSGLIEQEGASGVGIPNPKEKQKPNHAMEDNEMSELTAIDIKKGEEADPGEEMCTFICSRGSLDGAYPSLILAINARRLGMEATVFYTFMGINVIRKGGSGKCKFIPPGTLGAIPGMSAVATRMMRKQILEAGIPSVDELMEVAQLEGVKFVACRMTIDMMGLKEDDFIDGVEVQTAEDYLKHAKDCKINMFT
jgi:peroxiredoxin family protein